MPILEFAQGVPADGFYEITVNAEAVDRLQPYDPTNASSLEPGEPFRLAIVPGDQTAGTLHHPQPIEPVLAETTLGENGPAVAHLQGVARRRIHAAFYLSQWHAVRRYPEPGGSPPRQVSRRKRFRTFRSTRCGFAARFMTNGPPPASSWFSAARRLKPAVLARFSKRSRAAHSGVPARAEEVDGLMAVVEQRRQDGRSPLDALKDGLKAVLCSPAFLYLAESEPAAANSKALPAHALASRLSYFLWSTMPDAELTASAQSGELLKSEVLAAQTRRLLASPKSEAFVAGFLDSWLDLRSLGDMPPDRDHFLRYYADDLQIAMRRETQLFTRHLLDHNQSIVRFLDADYTFVNRPLAKLYGMEDAVGTADGHLFRQVKITDPNRGGLLGQASVLTVSANGVETSPVTRGVWLLENILGTPPAPPPDNVPALEPDVRGAKTIREILTKHRDNPACYECHRKIDPLGFALENFDPIGAWRSHYEKIEVTKRREVTRVVGALIDTSGELPGGESFQDIASLRKVLIATKGSVCSHADRKASQLRLRQTNRTARPTVRGPQS